MLVARTEGRRVEAQIALRGSLFACPHCDRQVILKRGQIKIAHFAHRPGSICPYAVGETVAHLQAKLAFRNALQSNGLRAEVEWPLLNQRADVIGWTQDNRPFVIELQHTELPIDILRSRIAGYRKGKLPQLWIPLPRPSIFDDHKDTRLKAVPKNDELFVERYSIRRFERYLAKIYKDNFWVYDWSALGVRLVRLNSHTLYHDGGSYGSAGEFAGEYYDSTETYPDYEYTSRRWREMTLSAIVALDQITLILFTQGYLGVKLVPRHEGGGMIALASKFPDTAGPNLCPSCGKTGTFGYGPPGWSEPIRWFCRDHRYIAEAEK